MAQPGKQGKPKSNNLLDDGRWEQLPHELRLEVERREFLLAYETEIAINVSLQLYAQKQEQDYRTIQYVFDNMDWEKFFWLLVDFINSWDKEDRIALTILALTCKTFNKYINLICPQLPKFPVAPKPIIQEDGVNFYCNICKVRIPHPKKYNQHILSKNHRRNLQLRQ